jgi:hypothetical protein
MPRHVSEPPDDVTVYLVLIDHGKHGIAYDETDPAEADLETTIQYFLTGRCADDRRGRLTSPDRPRFASAAVPAEAIAFDASN